MTLKIYTVCACSIKPHLGNGWSVGVARTLIQGPIFAQLRSGHSKIIRRGLCIHRRELRLTGLVMTPEVNCSTV